MHYASLNTVIMHIHKEAMHNIRRDITCKGVGIKVMRCIKKCIFVHNAMHKNAAKYVENMHGKTGGADNEK